MSWNGVKKQSYEQEIKSWCEEMGIKRYTINSQGEIDVEGNVSLSGIRGFKFKELSYKFGTVTGYFDIGNNPNLTSLKNCPDKVEEYFACNRCTKLDSLEGCSKKVGDNFWCMNCQREFTEKEVKSLCKVKRSIYN